MDARGLTVHCGVCLRFLCTLFSGGTSDLGKVGIATQPPRGISSLAR